MSHRIEAQGQHSDEGWGLHFNVRKNIVSTPQRINLFCCLRRVRKEVMIVRGPLAAP